MSWNEPGGDKKDPWSGRDQKGPPDLDEVIRSVQEKLGGLFGGVNRGSGKIGVPPKHIGIILIVVLLLWGLTGFYIVDEGTRGVVTRFGRYLETSTPGLNWHIPIPIERRVIVNVEQQRYFEIGYRQAEGLQQSASIPREALMLTKDENIVDIRLAVQYQVSNARNFLFNVKNIAAALKQVAESAQRGVIGNGTMDFVLTEGRTAISADIKTEVQRIIDQYEAGVVVISVNLQDAQPPEEVQGAFEDAIKAREDKQRFINEAEAYSNDVIPKARGAAARQIQEAEGYQARVIARAEGEASRFEQLLTEYKKAPAITRKRIYLESIESVLSQTDTIMVDVKGGNNLLYLPLDRLGRHSNSPPPGSSTKQTNSSPTSAPLGAQNLRSSNRGRDGRSR